VKGLGRADVVIAGVGISPVTECDRGQGGVSPVTKCQAAPLSGFAGDETKAGGAEGFRR
jgi:hypothetical protein